MGFCPEGAEQISPGQRPGTTKSNRTQALKGRHKAPKLFRPFRAQVNMRPDPRALPWADLWLPLRGERQRYRYSCDSLDEFSGIASTSGPVQAMPGVQCPGRLPSVTWSVTSLPSRLTTTSTSSPGLYRPCWPCSRRSSRWLAAELDDDVAFLQAGLLGGAALADAVELQRRPWRLAVVGTGAQIDAEPIRAGSRAGRRAAVGRALTSAGRSGRRIRSSRSSSRSRRSGPCRHS